MKFTLYTADCTVNAANCLYPHDQEISTPEELAAAIMKDQVFARYTGSYRSITNFLESDVIPMDCDNDHSDDPEDWLTAEKLEEVFSDVDHVIFPSRHHMLPKNGKAARPKYHILFPIAACTDPVMYAAVKGALQAKYDFFDDNALDAARFFFGSTCGPEDIVWHEGFLTVDETLDESDFLEPEAAADTSDSMGGPILAGSRNNTLSRFAGRVLKKYGITDKAHQLFRQRADQCDPPLGEAELNRIWSSAIKFAHRVQSQDGYIPPEEYNDDFGGGSLKPEDYSDIGQAKVLTREYGGELKYTKATDFLRHDGICWREEPQLALGAAEEFSDLQLQDAQDAVTNAMDALIAAGISEAVVKGGGKELEKSVPSGKMGLLFALVGAQAYLKFAMKYRNYKNIMNALNAARPMLAMYISDFDKDPNMLNTPLGTYDLAKGTGGMHPHNAEDYVTKVTNYAPGDDGADIWKDAIELFFCGDAELISYVQAMVGMAAVGKVYQEHMIIAYGGGANGKSTFWNAIFRVLGSYAGKISAEALTMNCKRNVKPEMAELKGKRLIIASELEEGTRLNTAIVKQLCSTDEIEAEKKYKDPFYFVPSHTLVLYTNHLPKVGANDDGIWRRLIVIPFNAKITGKSDIKNYADYLVDEAGPAIMKWIVEGAEKAIGTHFQTDLPQAVRDAIDHYRDSNDWLGQFLEEHCDLDPSYEEKSSELYQAYRVACMQSGEFIRSTADFYGALEKAGFPKRRKNNARMIVGLRLKDAQDFLE